MTFDSFLNPLLGGALIGVAVTLMLLFNGRVTGISGIINGAIGGAVGGVRNTAKSDLLWRVSFIGGLILGGLVLRSIEPGVFENTSGRSLGMTVLAGLIVGYGTIMGSGCTSGHGVCGISRMSVRSILATVTFIFFGVLAVAVIRSLLGGVA